LLLDVSSQSLSVYLGKGSGTTFESVSHLSRIVASPDIVRPIIRTLNRQYYGQFVTVSSQQARPIGSMNLFSQLLEFWYVGDVEAIHLVLFHGSRPLHML